MQAKYVPRGLIYNHAAGVKTFVWLLAAGTDGNEYDDFGIIHGLTNNPTDWTPRPVFHALQNTNALFSDTKFDRSIEIVSPANKDRPESRQLFVAKCYNLLRQDVCVSILDLVTVRQVNLYAELLKLMKLYDPRLGAAPSPTYVITCRKRQEDGHAKLDTWFHPLAVGQPLPSLPIWLSESQSVTIDLESSYEGTCQVLRIP